MEFNFNFDGYEKTLRKRTDYEVCCDLVCYEVLLGTDALSNSCFIDIVTGIESILFQELINRFKASVREKMESTYL